MSRRRVVPRPRTDPEIIRWLEQRVTALESPQQSMRVGQWTFVDMDGELRALKPGVINEVGQEIEPEDLNLGSLRGTYVTPAELEQRANEAQETAKDQVLGGLLEELTPPSVTTPSTPVAKQQTLGEWLRAQLFGQIDASRIGGVPLASIGTGDDNLLDNPHFVRAVSLSGGVEWVWDGTKTHSQLVEDAGSAKTTANGSTLELYSNPVAVRPGQPIHMRIFTQWSSLVASDAAIKLVAASMYGSTEVHREELQVVGSTGTQADWVELKGTYVVPAEINGDVAQISDVRLVLSVSNAATAGDVWYSDGLIQRDLAPGVAPSSWIDGLDGSIDALDENQQLTRANIMKALTGSFLLDWLPDEFEDEVNSWFEDTQTTAGEASDAKGGLADLIAAFLKGWNKEDMPSGGWTFPGLDDFFGMGLSKSQELTEIAAGLAQLQADVTGNNNSGRTLQLSMEEYAPSVPTSLTKFYDSGSGSVYNDGNTIQFSNNSGTELFIYSTEPLLTDYFEVSLIIPRHTLDYFGTYQGSIYFIGRGNHPTAPTEYCVAVLTGKSVRFGFVNEANPITAPLWFGPSLTVKTGSYMTFRGGVASDVRFFQLLTNNVVVANEIDEMDVSAVSALHRYVGAGLRHNAVDAINRSATISHFIANDNEPAPTIGTYCKVYRDSTSSVTLTSGSKVPNNFLNLTERTSADLEPLLGTNSGVRVKKAGAYRVHWQVRKSSTPISKGTQFFLTLWRDGQRVSRGGSSLGYMPGDQQSGGNAQIQPDLYGMWIEDTIYCEADNVIYPGYQGDTFAGIGNADGITTYMTITKVGGSAS